MTALDRIVVGDTLLFGKSPRVVRAITRRGELLATVCLAIRRCSWTGRAYTVYTRTDLRSMGVKVARMPRQALQTGADRKLARCIRIKEDRTLGCCDVMGWP